MFRKDLKAKITDYQWRPSDVRKYFQNNYFKLKRESIPKYRKYRIESGDILLVLPQDYYGNFRDEDDEDEENSGDIPEWEVLPDSVIVDYLTCNVFDHSLSEKIEKLHVDPNDLELRKYSAGYFEFRNNLYFVRRVFDQHNYGKGVTKEEYRVIKVVSSTTTHFTPDFKMGVFIDTPFKDGIIKERINSVVSLEKPYGILTKHYVIQNSDTHKYPIIKYREQVVGYFDTDENEVMLPMDSKIADKIRGLYNERG